MLPQTRVLVTGGSGLLGLLDWEPRMALEEGLTRTVEYFDRLLRSGDGLRQP